MTREEYISYKRSGNSLMIMYKHYIEHYDKEKHYTFSSPNDFAMAIQQWEGFMFLNVKLERLYDVYFELVVLLLKSLV